MHIPDGYLSPQTTLPIFAGMIPFWGVALNKVKKTVSNKRVPLLALGAAFTFVIMMFNIPVAGGSSAHAVGAVLIAILLGPWAACISVTAALLIQAFVFGDGGIIALGVNCLNMAVIMPFFGYWIFRLIKGNAAVGSKRGFISVFIGSYAGINLAAFFAALELGIQPLLFKASDGTPLYGFYPLSVSIPAMAFAHLLFAGPLEGIVTTAAVAYISKFAPHFITNIDSSGSSVSFFKRYRIFLIPIGVLLLLTPLGLLANGTAWAEWGTDEIRNKLGYIPRGLSKLADWWHSLMPDYSVPAFGESGIAQAAGYILSAVVGIALITFLIFLASRLMMTFKKREG